MSLFDFVAKQFPWPQKHRDRRAGASSTPLQTWAERILHDITGAIRIIIIPFAIINFRILTKSNALPILSVF